MFNGNFHTRGEFVDIGWQKGGVPTNIRTRTYPKILGQKKSLTLRG